MVTTDIEINLTRGAQHVTLYPAGSTLPCRCFWFLVTGRIARSASCWY